MQFAAASGDADQGDMEKALSQKAVLQWWAWAKSRFPS
jgi:hypothetical protein